MRSMLISLALLLTSAFLSAFADGPRSGVSNVADAVEHLGPAEQAALAEIADTDQTIQSLEGRKIGEKEVREVVHVTRLDPHSLADRNSGQFVVLSDASVVDSRANFAEFNTSGSAEDAQTPNVAFTFVPQPDDVGRLYVVVFNVHSYTSNFAYELVISADGKTHRRGAKGLGTGNHRIPRHFEVESDDPISISFRPLGNARWWFGACDVYTLR